MSDRGREVAEAALLKVLREVRVRHTAEASIEALFMRRLLSPELRHYAYVVIRHALDPKLGEEGRYRGAPLAGRVIAASSPSAHSDGGGQGFNARPGHSDIALPSDPDTATPDEGGQSTSVTSRDHRGHTPSSGSSRDGDGHGDNASNGHHHFASPSRPKPKAMDPSFREALLAEKMATAHTILFALHDGRDIMRVKMRELPAYRAIGARQAEICNRILLHAANAGPEQQVGEVIAEVTLKTFVTETERGLRHAWI